MDADEEEDSFEVKEICSFCLSRCILTRVLLSCQMDPNLRVLAVSDRKITMQILKSALKDISVTCEVRWKQID